LAENSNIAYNAIGTSIFKHHYEKEIISVLINSDFDTLFEKAFDDWHKSVSPGSVFIAAVSGGADSTAMLIALKRLSKKRNYRISCLHVRHNIRSAAESEADAEFVRSLCQRLNVPLRIVTIKPGKIAEKAAEKGVGIEAAAREYRQAAYKHEVKRLGAEKIVVAHNQNDVLENSLMRILRGAGPRGLASMPSTTKLILRPMIHISRNQILNYLEMMNQPYQTDLSNHDNHYFRNRVRNVLIPVLNEHFPYWESGIESLGKTQSYLAEYAESEAKRLGKWQICENGLETACEHFDSLNPVIQEEAVFQGIAMILNDFSCEIEDFRNQYEAKNAKMQVEGFFADFPREYTVPKRLGLRKFLQSKQNSMDLGKIRLERSGENLRILLWKDLLAVKGGTFCAEKPGFYQFMNYSIQIDENITSESQFTCEIPVIFRTPLIGEKIPSKILQKMKTKNTKNSIIVEDRNGKIAFLSIDGNIFLYEERKSLGKNTVSIKISMEKNSKT
jgi:tRNA(Ile)-lysidine synthase